MFRLRSVDTKIDRFCQKHPKLAVPGLIRYVLIGTVIVYLLDMFSQSALTELLAFVPHEILQGQVWRLVTFVFVPFESTMVFFAIEVYFIWWSSGLLEQEWGSCKTTLFYLSGVLLNIIVGLLLGGALELLGLPSAFATADVYYLNLSLFFAFATLFSEVRIMLFMVLPVKAKWLAWISAALLAYRIFSGFFAATNFVGLALGLLLGLIWAVPALLAIANYFLFFWSDIAHFVGRKKRRIQHQTSRQTIDFKKATKAVKDQKAYLHKCAVCGRTNADSPDLEFRYCSRCAGYHCYCMDHINNHTHVE